MTSSASVTGIGMVDVTLRDLGTPPWGSRIAPDDLGAAAAALAPVGARVIEVMDPAAARACMDGRTESPLDRLRVVARHALGAPLGIVVTGQTLLGTVPVGAGVARRLMASVAASGGSRVRAYDGMNDPESLRGVAEGAAEAGLGFVPTLMLGPEPDSTDPRWLEEAMALIALPGTVTLCVSDLGGNLTPMRMGAFISSLVAASSVPVEVSLRATGGLASMSALSAALAGADAIHASVGAAALVAGRPSAEALDVALHGGDREFQVDVSALEEAGRIIWPLVAQERVRRAAELTGGPQLQLPPDLAAGLMARLARQGLTGKVHEAAEECAAVSRDLGGVTLAPPLGEDLVTQAGQHIVDGVRWREMSRTLADIALGNRGRHRGPVSAEALAVARGAGGTGPVPDLDEVLAAAPPDVSEEDALILAQFPVAGARLIDRRRSLGAEEAGDDGIAIDRGLIETLVQVVEGAGHSEVVVEIGGARVTVRPVQAAGGPASTGPTVPADDGIRVESPMVGTFYSSPSPDADPFVAVGDRVVQGQVLCIIEAMKIFNEITAERAGTVREITVQNSEPVEFGQALFILTP
ncbi:MAG: acetyl-CoA carboxylase biotin carboxyl carrier protein [Thermoleophilia bacterium]|nr:acetyl-CoA carboxylase biotin carboxyl carrier protein [Thermoleophilia bacterium]